MISRSDLTRKNAISGSDLTLCKISYALGFTGFRSLFYVLCFVSGAVAKNFLPFSIFFFSFSVGLDPCNS
jgi:hypothetical protein